VDSGLSTIFMSVGISLLTLGFIKKGFETYILYTDGDPDSDPIQLFTLLCKAIAVLCGFDAIYKWLAYIVTKLTTDSLTAIRVATGTDFISIVDTLKCADNGTNIMLTVLGIIFGVLYFILYFSVIKNSVEIFVLKIGLPIACIGLLHADKGIFKNYMMSLMKAFVTILVKIILTQIGFSMVLVGGAISNKLDGDIFTNGLALIIGIVCISLALSSPKLLAELFMIPSGGGSGIAGKAYHITSLVSRIRK